MDIDKLDRDVKEALVERGHSEKEISEMTPEEAFDEFCEWNGLIRWGHTLRRVMVNLKEA